jgi:hypothetical protein
MLTLLLSVLALQQSVPADPRDSDFAREIYDNIRKQLPSAPDESAIRLPVDPRHMPPRATAEWLAGYWVVSKGECYGGDFGMSFSADGSFSDYWFSGTFKVKAGTLHQRIKELTDSAEPGDRVGQRFSRQLKLVGPNELILGAGREAERFYRCPEGGMKD